jgi:SAM-dependent methyltransferase
MKEFWNERYANEAFAYGESPNTYFEENIKKYTVGKLLLPAEGEGRNGVAAARLGWQVEAFDLSESGRQKAQSLAEKHHVEINYQVGEFSELTFEQQGFDAIGLIYAHFPANLKSQYHQKLIEWLKPGGIVIFEAFSKNHLRYRTENPSVGGPNELDMLFSIDEIKADFANFEVIELLETEVELSEGQYHQGKGSVIRFIGQKI